MPPSIGLKSDTGSDNNEGLIVFIGSVAVIRFIQVNKIMGTLREEQTPWFNATNSEQWNFLYFFIPGADVA